MKRRDFLTTALAGLGATVSTLSVSDALAQQNRQIAPIASIAANTPRGMAYVRAYPGATQREFIVMARVAGRDIWRRVQLGSGAANLLRPAAEADRMRGQIGPSGGEMGTFEIRNVAGGNNYDFALRLPGLDDIEGQGTGGGTDGGGGTQSLGFWGALVAIVAIFALVAIVAMATGSSVDMNLRMRGVGVGITVGAPSDDPPDGGSFQHDPICDTMPPMNC